MALDRPLVRAPEFPPVEWLNTPAAPSLGDLRGQVLLVDIWDFTCINCLRTLPTLRDWQARYADAGLVTLGVHTPEFPFAHAPRAVRSAIGRLGIRWPVALDSDQRIWTAYANHAWPTVYLVDRGGYIRYRREGEGGYADLEAALRSLLLERRPGNPSLPPPLSTEQEDAARRVCLPATPEMQVESVGNGPLFEKKSIHLSLPSHRAEGSFYLDGDWRLMQRGVTLDSERGQVVLPFQAASVHAVIAPSPDDEADLAGLGPMRLEVLLDGRPVPSGRFGRDLLLRQGCTWLPLDTARTYDVVQSLEPGPHELRFRLDSPGTTLYAFSFGACPEPSSSSRSAPC